MHPALQSLVVRLPVAVALVVAAVLAGSLAVAYRVSGAAARQSVQRTLEGTRSHVRAALSERERATLATAGVLAQSPAIRAAVLFGNPADAVEHAVDAADYLGADWVELRDGSGALIARSDAPRDGAAASGADAARPESQRGADDGESTRAALVVRALGGASVTGYVAGARGQLFQGIAVPVHDAALAADGTVVGAMIVANVLDSVFLAGVREATGGRTEIVAYVVDETLVPRLAASTLPATDELHTTLATWSPSASEQLGGGARTDLVFAGRRYVWLGTSLLATDGSPVGGVLVLRSRDAELAPFHALARAMLVTGLVGIAGAFGLAVVLVRRTTKSATALAGALRRARAGDLDTPPPGNIGDEIGVATDEARQLMAELADRQAVAAHLRAEATHLASRSNAPGGAGDGARSVGAAVSPSVSARYQILSAPVPGPEGATCDAFDPARGARISLRLVSPSLLEQTSGGVDALRRDVALARRVAHPNIVRVHDLDEVGDTLVVAADPRDGVTLEELLNQGDALPANLALAIVRQVLRGIEAVHAAGAVHRGLTPSKVLARADGSVRVADLGLGSLVRRAVAPAAGGGVAPGVECLAPEQLSGDEGDARTDLYAVGALAYRCLTGRPPHLADSPMDLVTRVLEEPVTWPADAPRTVPGHVVRAILAALERDPARRWQRAREFHDSLSGTGVRG